MSSPAEVTARVRTFYGKAEELQDKGHMLRAADYYSRAAEGSRALGADNVVTADLQRCEAHALLNYLMVVDDATADARVVASHRANCVALLTAAVATLERRRVAGTLLEGKCTSDEEAWDAALWRDAGYSAADAAVYAKLVGYGFFLRLADTMFGLLRNPLYFVECSAAQFEAFTQHVGHAAELMQIPRSHDTSSLNSEDEFVKRFSSAVQADASGVPFLEARGLDASVVQPLTDAWQRLKRSGVLDKRGILDEIRRQDATGADAFNAVIRAAMAAPSLRTCALAGCRAKEAHPQHFKHCSACKGVVYCSKEHQLEAWPAHKAACKAARKAAAASSDGGGAGPGTA